MTVQSRHLSVAIQRPADEVYRFAGNPANLPRWAAGLSSSVTEQDGQWVADSPMGQITIEFAPANEFGVLDHAVTMPSGQVVHNPMRVLTDGEGCEVVFTVRSRDGMTTDEFEADCAAVAADLAGLQQLLET
ncbi:MAG: SRPBCC family protein [Jatrophihabitantaceae bacterium]